MVPVIASLLKILGSNAFEACCTGLEESVTCTVKLDWPALVGVPLIFPFVLKLRPAGNVPDVTVHEYGVVPPEAVSVVEYAVPSIPFGNEAVVIFSDAPEELMLIESGLVAFWIGKEESATCTVKLDWPAPVGVPLIVPPLLKLRPAGNAPDVSVHEYGTVPPIAVSVDEYAVPTIPPGKEAVVIVSGSTLAITLMENGLVAFCTGAEESVTCTVKSDWPAVVGVPLMVPSLLKLRPAGNAPDVTVHEYGSVPPVAVSVVEYADPTAPFGNEEVVIFSLFCGFTLISNNRPAPYAPPAWVVP
jgi:hypothetical protein